MVEIFSRKEQDSREKASSAARKPSLSGILGARPKVSGGHRVHTHPLLSPSGPLPTFNLACTSLQEMGTTCGDHCRGAPKQVHCAPHREGSGSHPRSQPGVAALRKSGSNETWQLGGWWGLWRTHSWEYPLLFLPRFLYLIRKCSNLFAENSLGVFCFVLF